VRGLAGSGGGASAGGSSATVVLCEGVWLRDEWCVTVGDTAATQSVPRLPAHRTGALIRPEAIGPVRSREITADLRGGVGASARGEAECCILRLMLMLLSP
jgi:hypothetical protein